MQTIDIIYQLVQLEKLLHLFGNINTADREFPIAFISRKSYSRSSCHNPMAKRDTNDAHSNLHQDLLSLFNELSDPQIVIERNVSQRLGSTGQ
jgi:hypothetical protein